ncbi:MAG TPA: hypothetical protein VGB39_05760, partial [Sphingomicrobium sp.]
ETSNKFLLDSRAITGVEVVKAQYVSIDDRNSRFDLWGFIDFALIGGPATPFDIFSFGGTAGADDPYRTGLAFSGLALGMSVDSAQNKTFTPDYGKMAFDVARSTPRPGSLYSDFALRPPAIVVGTADAGPLDRGYLTVGSTAPTLTGVGQGKAWFGLSFGLDMGSIGALAGGAGLTATMLCAWAPKASGDAVASDGSAFPVQLGLALPGVNPTAKLMSLEGVLRLGIGELSITHAPVATADGTASKEPYWVLSLDDIGLKFLGFYKIPPSGSISFTCFGNPGADAAASALGWYAVYNQTPPTPGGAAAG